MWLCLGLCILAIAGSSPSDAATSDRVTLFECEFGEASDRDFNDWPDRWTRRRGPGFPPYVKARLDFDANDDTHGRLRIDANGASVAVLSPLIDVDPRHSLAVEAIIKTADLVADQARVTLTLFDAGKQPLATWHSPSVSRTTGWTKVEIPPSHVLQGQPRYAVLAMELESGQPADLHGTAWFQQVRLIRLPLLRIDASHHLALYEQPSSCALDVSVSGLRQAAPSIELQVFDHLENRVAREVLTPEWKHRAPADEQSPHAQSAPELHTLLRYEPRLQQYGYFRARATLRTSDGSTIVAECPITIAQPIVRRTGQYGLSLGDTMPAQSHATLLELASASAIGWLKLPLWQSVNEPPSPRSPDRLVQDLAARGVRPVGILATPPDDVCQQLTEVNLRAAADLFAAPANIWHPSARTVFVRYGLEVDYWQLGGDRDRSFVGYPDVLASLADIKRRLESDGEAFRLGIGWDWTEAFPEHAAAAPISFLAMSAEPPLAAHEVGAYVAARSSSVAHWAQVDPRWLATQPVDQRGAALVRWMVEAAASGSQAIFFLDPFATEAGLFDERGRPTALFLPWRTTASALAGAVCVGELQLASGSHNRVFVRGEEAIVVVWSDSSQHETLRLGDDLRACDIYGSAIELERDVQGAQLTVDSAPRFVFGASAPVARWQLDVAFEHDHIPSIPGRPCQQQLHLVNSFASAVSGRARLVVPKGWIVRPSEFDFEIPAGGTFTQDLSITLRFGADCGLQPVTVDCEVFADRVYQIETLRFLHVGGEDVEFFFDTQLVADDLLEIELLLVNNTERPVQFLCNLFARDRRRQQFVLSAPALSQTPHTLRLSGGEQLLGETLWLQAAEVRSDRVLNYRPIARP